MLTIISAYGTIEGTVEYISADSIVNQDKGSVAYLVKVTVDAREFGRGELRGSIKLGLTGQAEILTGRESLFLSWCGRSDEPSASAEGKKPRERRHLVLLRDLPDDPARVAGGEHAVRDVAASPRCRRR